MTKLPETIDIRHARTHNLKDVTVSIPRGRITVVTGVSGSGKSSLAYDTLYAEGQRRYVETLSPFARQMVKLAARPDVEEITGLPPAIAIDQRTALSGARSTVGSLTELSDYWRLLFARAGTPLCPVHHLPLAADPVAAMVEKTLALPPGSRVLILAPVMRSGKEPVHALLGELLQKGFMRFRIDGALAAFDAPPCAADWSAELPHTVDVVVDRVKIRPGLRERLASSLETAAGLAQGRTAVLCLEDNRLMRFSTRLACPECDFAFGALEPGRFSPNAPEGWCPSCRGAGETEGFLEELLVTSPSKSLEEGAIPHWGRENEANYKRLRPVADGLGFSLETPWRELPDGARDAVLRGSALTPSFPGILTELEHCWAESGAREKNALRRFRAMAPCRACGGTGLGPSASVVHLGESASSPTLPELLSWPISELRTFFAGLSFEGSRAVVARRLLEAIRSRLDFLCDVGVGYLQPGRRASTLSGGEMQRIRLASQIGSGLTGVLYVLDEPSIGLHPRDNRRLIAAIGRLRDEGNTVVVVEHDRETMESADWLIEMGPGAGEAGGSVTAEGTPPEVLRNPASLTGRCLSGALRAPERQRRRALPEKGWLELTGARGHNLKSVHLRVPVGAFTVVSGVSGSGKSSLIGGTLIPALRNVLGQGDFQKPLPFDGLEGAGFFDKVVSVDQAPIGRSPRSNPATFAGLFEGIREVFAQTQVARERGYGASRFSFNSRGGRCEACQGEGLVKIDMKFLPDVYVPCDVCGGSRFNRETLECRYRGKSIADVLEMTFGEAVKFFEPYPALRRRMQAFLDVGLGYLRLGQSATTLSGGEAQRVKLARELARPDAGRTLYVFDEPTTGLHFADIALLLKALFELTGRGNTVLVVEHNLEVIRAADHVVDLGPEGGEAGGRIVAAGSPADIAASPESMTGKFLGEVV